jgi:endonuclease/exonuclease/phosphatase
MLILCFAGCVAACKAESAAAGGKGADKSQSARVITCNVRVTGLPEDEVPGRKWEERRTACVGMIRAQNPDIICSQEVMYDSYEYMKEQFSDYFAFGFAGPEMDPYTEGYHYIAKNVIFFSRARYEFISAGGYWLSEEPLIAGSMSWNTMRARHCNWVRLMDKKTGRQFRVLDVHLDHKSDEARKEQMKVIIAECAQYAEDFPQILCGDFNSGITHAPIGALREAGWLDMYEQVHGPGEAGFTGHAFLGEDFKKRSNRIDFIFMRGAITASNAEILRDKINGIYPSDHYFVMADFIIQ